MFSGEAFTIDASAIAAELADCRKRGVESIDRRTHNQAPLALPQLDHLALMTTASARNQERRRSARIKDLLRRALSAYGERHDPAEARLISDLFFGDSTSYVRRTAGELLDLAMAHAGEQNEERFRERRRVAFHDFAHFLIQYAPEAADPVAKLAPSPASITGEPTAVTAPGATATPIRAAPLDLAEEAALSSEHRRIEAAIQAASSITICGVAPRSLVQTMQRIAQHNSVSSSSTPWRRITYVTPAAALIFATLGNARIASAIQNWQSAIKGIHDCVAQVQSAAEALSVPTGPDLSLLSVAELFLNVLILIKTPNDDREHLWVSAGPELARDEPCYLGVGPDTEPFRQLRAVIDKLTASGTPIVSRELEMRPDGLELIRQLADSPDRPVLQVRALRPIADSTRGSATSRPSCLPVALVILRSVQAGSPLILLKRRSRFADWDDFDKLSLLSSGLLEEDLAGALGVPVFPNLDAPIALDAMWKALGEPGPLPIPLSAFVRAAQRELFASCGLELPAERYLHRGCHLLERDEHGRYLFFCVFEVTLRRSGAQDELRMAWDWDSERLHTMAQDVLYSAENAPYLNRFLIQCKDWIESEVLANPISLLRVTAKQPSRRLAERRRDVVQGIYADEASLDRASREPALGGQGGQQAGHVVACDQAADGLRAQGHQPQIHQVSASRLFPEPGHQAIAVVEHPERQPVFGEGQAASDPVIESRQENRRVIPGIGVAKCHHRGPFAAQCGKYGEYLLAGVPDGQDVRYIPARVAPEGVYGRLDQRVIVIGHDPDDLMADVARPHHVLCRRSRVSQFQKRLVDSSA